MQTIPNDYTFCTDRQCPLKNDCLRLVYPKGVKALSFTRFEAEWDESLKKYVCNYQITYEDYFGFKRGK